MMPAVRPSSLAALLLSAFLACGGGGDPVGPGPSPGTINMTATTFSPSSVSIQSGGTVTWTNNSGVQHNVTFGTSGAPASIPTHASGSNSRTFASAGTFAFSCTLHPATMTGSVIVQ